MSTKHPGVLVFGFLAVTSCNGDDGSLPDIETLFPANGEVGAWVEDTAVSNRNPGVDVATDDDAVVDLIDGGAGPFLDRDYTAFAIENYTDNTYDLELRVWQFASAAIAAELYVALLTESSTHQASNWETASIGNEGRVANTLTDWWFNTRESVYLIEAKIAAIDSSSPDATSKTAGETFLAAVLGKIE